MNPHKRTRSLFKFDATAQAVGQGAFPALSSKGKLSAIAGLAGLVLRLFRHQDHLEGSPKASRRHRPGKRTCRCPRRNSGGRSVTAGNPQPSTDRLAA